MNEPPRPTGQWILNPTANKIVLLFFVSFFMVLFSVSARAQTTEQPVYPTEHQDFFIAPLAEVIGYGRKGPNFGGGLAIGAGSGAAIGARLLYAADTESVNALELAVFIRFYFFGPEASAGPFVQINAGTAVFARESAVSLPAQVGTISAGLAAGWRFLLGNRWYIEPAVRAGYPYISGTGVSAGFRF